MQHGVADGNSTRVFSWMVRTVGVATRGEWSWGCRGGACTTRRRQGGQESQAQEHPLLALLVLVNDGQRVQTVKRR